MANNTPIWIKFIFLIRMWMQTQFHETCFLVIRFLYGNHAFHLKALRLCNPTTCCSKCCVEKTKGNLGAYWHQKQLGHNYFLNSPLLVLKCFTSNDVSSCQCTSLHIQVYNYKSTCTSVHVVSLCLNWFAMIFFILKHCKTWTSYLMLFAIGIIFFRYNSVI